MFENHEFKVTFKDKKVQDLNGIPVFNLQYGIKETGDKGEISDIA